MANPRDEQITYPFTNFNFAVQIKVEGVAEQVCDAAFAECDGLEMTMEVKTIREVGSSRVDLQACKLEYSIVSPK